MNATYDKHSTMLNLIERGKLTEATIAPPSTYHADQAGSAKITLSMLARDKAL
jgi:hypothetical protein